MILVLDDNISQDFWRLVYPPTKSPGTKGLVPPGLLKDERWACNEIDVNRMAPRWADEQFLSFGAAKLSCLVPEARFQRESHSHVTRLWSGPLPPDSLYDLGNNVYVPSPAFTFLLMATKTSLAELVAYGMELCGLYAFDAQQARGIRKRAVPLLECSQLASYIDSARGLPGFKRSSNAVRFMADRSASPMETLVEMLFCLPYRLGGYCLPKPSMNFEVPLAQHTRIIAQRSKCYADLCYPKISLDVEYHGEYDHEGRDDFDSDRARINALRILGYEVIELTSEQVGSLRAFEEIVAYIASRLGKRLVLGNLGPTQERISLREALYSWNHRYGHP